MILEALVHQLKQRLQHEKRAHVCLWFDPSREFARLIPKLDAHLSGLAEPPFVLLAYDPERFHGQVWLKHRIHSELAGLSDVERRRRRYVLYFPLDEDRLDSPDARRAHHLELMAEYRYAGLTWRVGGKRPTLFRFLREVGVELTAAPTDQRKLYDGGYDSLLAKYVARFADRPAAFWEVPLTSALAQERLLGDVDYAVIQLAIDPDAGWAELEAKGLGAELLAAVEERFGFSHPMASPSRWVREMVAVVALTETVRECEDASDFPFAQRLAPMTVWPHHQALVKRWLHDTEGRPAWERWIAEVEREIDLTAWASARGHMSFAFPHLGRHRWATALAELEAAAGKTSTTATFFAERLEAIKLEAAFTRASEPPIGAWSLLQALGELIEECRVAEHWCAETTEPSGLAKLYVEHAGRIDGRHVRVRREADLHGLPVVTGIADRHYASYTNALNNRFFKGYAKQSAPGIAGIPEVTEHLERAVWDGEGRRAVVIVDALRYDCGLAIAERLAGLEVSVRPMRAELPTITPVGMTALMPISRATVQLEVKGAALHPRVNGKDCSQRAQRLAFMTEGGADCRDIVEVEGASEAPEGLGELLVVFGHDEVDHIGHGSAHKLIRHLELEIERIARLVRRLHRWGYERVHVVTDHGFVLLDEAKLPDEVVCDKEWCVVRKERFALVRAEDDVPLASFPCAWEPALRVAVPPGLAFFKAEKSFSHGGAALQELIIPHLTSKSRVKQETRVGVEVVLPTYELTRTAVKVVLRAKAKGAKQLSLFPVAGRTLAFDVRRAGGADAGASVLAAQSRKELRLEAGDGERAVTLFFHTAQTFAQGELLELDIRDVETTEQFPPGGIKLTIGRDM